MFSLFFFWHTDKGATAEEEDEGAAGTTERGGWGFRDVASACCCSWGHIYSIMRTLDHSSMPTHVHSGVIGG